MKKESLRLSSPFKFFALLWLNVGKWSYIQRVTQRPCLPSQVVRVCLASYVYWILNWNNFIPCINTQEGTANVCMAKLHVHHWLGWEGLAARLRVTSKQNEVWEWSYIMHLHAGMVSSIWESSGCKHKESAGNCMCGWFRPKSPHAVVSVTSTVKWQPHSW